jgi:hypothetical protein
MLLAGILVVIHNVGTKTNTVHALDLLQLLGSCYLRCCVIKCHAELKCLRNVLNDGEPLLCHIAASF